VGQLALTNYINARERVRRPAPPKPASEPRTGPSAANAFAMVFRTRYLLLMGLMLMFVNWVNTTGEYILGRIVKDTAAAHIAQGLGAGVNEEQFIANFYSQFYTYVNGLGLLLQLLVVSRVVKYLGIAWGVMIVPLISLGAYNVIMFIPVLTAVMAAKVAENASDYSLNNTVRNMLFLPCTYEQKFSGKQAIDSFFVRMGDVLSAALVFVSTSIFVLQPRGFAFVNALLAIVWLALAWRVGRYYKRLTETGVHPEEGRAAQYDTALRRQPG
jgi:AAA family ATP:ADP antiporter